MIPPTDPPPYRPMWTPSDPVQTLWVVVFGIDGTNGMRGTQAQHANRLQKLEDRTTEIQTIWRVVRWTILTVGGAVGMILSQPLGEIVGRWLR